MKTFHAWRQESLGWMACLMDGGTVRRLSLPRRTKGEALASVGCPAGERARPAPASLARCLGRYFRTGVFRAAPAASPESATPFQRRVWRETARIPSGRTRTYGWIAGRVGRPGGARAVGRALGANPLPLFVP